MPAASHPDTRSVRGSNMCRIAVHQPEGGDIAVVLSVIDNLTKGAAGQAVQNMNLMCRTAGSDGIRPDCIVAVTWKLKRIFGISTPHVVRAGMPVLLSGNWAQGKCHKEMLPPHARGCGWVL